MAKRDHFQRIQRLRYHHQRYRNPYFQKKRQIPWKLISFFSSGLLLGVLFLWIFFGSPLFKITSVQFEGIEYLSQEELTESVWNYLHKRRSLFFTNENKFLFDAEILKEYLEIFYSFDDLNITVQKNHSIFISLKEKTSGLLWNAQDRTYIADLHGLVIREISQQESEWILLGEQEEDFLEKKKFLSMPHFRDLNDIQVTIGENVLTSHEIDAIFLFQKYLTSQSVPFKETQIDRLSGKWMGILTQDGYLILFDASGDINAQASHLKNVMSQPNIILTDLEYIDVRFGDHVYYK